MDFDDDFDELAAVAYRTAFRILGSRAEAEEVAQETLTKALMRWRGIRSHARPWVCRVAANEAIGVLRKRRRVPAGADAAHVATDAAVDRLDLQRALLSLPRRQRQVMVLRYLLDMAESDVASELGMALGTVKAHAHRALVALRVAMRPEVDVEPIATREA